MHFQDQITKLGFDRGPPQWARTTLPPPVQTKPAAVPADHGLRPDEDECMAPSGPEPRQPHPEDSIGFSESNSSPCALALQYNKLMAEGDHLGVERGLAPQETPERAEKGREGGRQHRNHVDPPGGKHQCSREVSEGTGYPESDQGQFGRSLEPSRARRPHFAGTRIPCLMRFHLRLTHTLAEFIEPCLLAPGVHLIEVVCSSIKTIRNSLVSRRSAPALSLPFSPPARTSRPPPPAPPRRSSGTTGPPVYTSRQAAPRSSPTWAVRAESFSFRRRTPRGGRSRCRRSRRRAPRTPRSCACPRSSPGSGRERDTTSRP